MSLWRLVLVVWLSEEAASPVRCNYAETVQLNAHRTWDPEEETVF